MADAIVSDVAPPPAIEPEGEHDEPRPIVQANVEVSRLVKILSETSGLDATLLTLQYPLLVLLALSRRKASPKLKALVGLISDVRVFLRLPGLLKIYLWAVKTINKPPVDSTLNAITWGQIVASAAFQAFENVAYLSQHGILGLNGRQRTRAALWSARAWALHIFLDLLRLGRLRQMQREKASGDEKQNKIVRRADHQKWWRELVIDTAYAPLTVHYSLDAGAVGDLWVGLLGSVVSLLSWKSAWAGSR